MKKTRLSKKEICRLDEKLAYLMIPASINYTKIVRETKKKNTITKKGKRK